MIVDPKYLRELEEGLARAQEEIKELQDALFIYDPWHPLLASPMPPEEDEACIQCNAKPGESCLRDHRGPDCWMEKCP